jgi:polar amino acid transport system permease protein
MRSPASPEFSDSLPSPLASPGYANAPEPPPDETEATPAWRLNSPRGFFASLGWTDLAVVGALLLLLAFMSWRIRTTLHYQWNWGSMGHYLVFRDAASGAWRCGLLVQGLLATLRLSLWATLLGCGIGIPAGIGRGSRHVSMRFGCRCYVELARNLPPLVLIFIFYFFVSDQLLAPLGIERLARSLTGWPLALFRWAVAAPEHANAFVSAIVTLALYEGAYIAEIVRAGIQAVPRGQWEAAQALGLGRFSQFRDVILPQALVQILPALAGQFISVIKDSAIVSVISIQELTFQGNELTAATYRTFEVWLTVSLMYLGLTLTCSLAASALEKRLRHR